MKRDLRNAESSCRRGTSLRLLLAFLFFALYFFASSLAASEIRIESALVKLIDQQEVPAREEGTLIDLAVEEGSLVEQGAVLAQLDDSEARFAQQRAAVELAIAEQNAESTVAVRAAERTLQSAAAELRRAEDARDRLRQVVTETEIERLRLAADQAQLAVEKAQQDNAVARLTRDLKKVESEFSAAKVARHHVTAPFAGVVVQVHKRRGEWVQPGDKVLRLIRLDRLRVEGFLPAAQASRKLAGTPVTLTTDLPGKPGAVFHGTLKFLSPEIDPFNKSVRVLADIENPTLTLQPGLRGTLAIDSR